MSTTAAKKTASAPKVEATTKATTPQQKLLAEARTAALGRLLDEHRSRFNDLMAEEAKVRNVTWKRKLTQDEKDEAALVALLKKNPALAQRAVELAGAEGDPDQTTDLSGESL